MKRASQFHNKQESATNNARSFFPDYRTAKYYPFTINFRTAVSRPLRIKAAFKNPFHVLFSFSEETLYLKQILSYYNLSYVFFLCLFYGFYGYFCGQR